MYMLFKIYSFVHIYLHMYICRDQSSSLFIICDLKDAVCDIRNTNTSPIMLILSTTQPLKVGFVFVDLYICRYVYLCMDIHMFVFHQALHFTWSSTNPDYQHVGLDPDT